VKISRLRLTGFKSFVEPTDLIVEEGLNGVVGPNGCGKSNLLEAMRWVMGENSPKNMRSSGMDDVIFSGTTGRPARNFAEVVLHLDNSDRTAPAAYNGEDTLEVSRRIEREAGSVYRINGQDVRAKDVQLLFADASTGAHSPALVRQGQIGELINAKPQNRRAILEEAAGITGLHSRRHEAELRLRGAENNLLRLDDVVQQLEVQLAGLKRQARQARRYRNLSGLIRQAEAVLLHIRWTNASNGLTETDERQTEIDQRVEEATQATAEATNRQLAAGEKIPPLRDSEAEAAAGLHRLTIERENLDQEKERAVEEIERLEALLTQIAEDLGREKSRVQDATEVLERLDTEESDLTSLNDTQEQAIVASNEKVTALSEDLTAKETTLDAQTTALAELRAKRSSLTNTIDGLASQIERASERLQSARAEFATLTEQTQDFAEIREAKESVQQAESTAEQSKNEAEAAERLRHDTHAEEEAARGPLREADESVNKLRAEIKGLASTLGVDETGLWPPIIESVSVEPGYEKALGAALGEDLSASTDIAAPTFWTDLGISFDDGSALPALPEGVIPLSDYVKGPEALERRLSQIGLVEAAVGSFVQSQLRPGQRIVSTQGDIWRWDGYCASCEAPSAAAVRLAQKNKLAELETELAAAEGKAQAARDHFHEKRQQAEEAASAEKQKRSAWREAEDRLAAQRGRLAEIEREQSGQVTQLAALKESIERSQQDLESNTERKQAATSELDALAAEESIAQQIEALRLEVSELRTNQTEARAERDALVREADSRRRRLAQIGEEKQAWTDRSATSTGQIETLGARREQLSEELNEKRQLPQQITEKSNTLLQSIGEAEQKRKDAADTLAIAESELADADKQVKQSQQAQSNAREERARISAQLEAARERISEIEDRVREVLDCSPNEIIEQCELTEKDLDTDIESIEKKLERLKRERENMGGVNLRADDEATECEEKLQGMLTEREDLEAAIAKLRQGISKLNVEGRQRLLEAFTEINKNFTHLFTRLFGGGTAELQLVESDDPLEAGLEIFARPPGKKLQSMSLLSGGEQALTAMSLIFAVFLCNPAPICVLDEVDAPLDDVNVERFCNLLDEMRQQAATRFIVITHHPLTMSRMDRLFGVTMAERGVSQLVSVDLSTAEQVRAAG